MFNTSLFSPPANHTMHTHTQNIIKISHSDMNTIIYMTPIVLK